MVHGSPNQTCPVLSFWNGRILDGGGVVLLVQAAGKDDGGREEGQLDQLPSLCRNHQWDGEVSKDLTHQSCVLGSAQVSLLAHLLYALLLLLLLFLPKDKMIGYLFVSLSVCLWNSKSMGTASKGTVQFLNIIFSQ